MNTSVITFQVDEQILIKTGGVDDFASDPYSYVVAEFTLGQNWDSFDSVRAIFSTRHTIKQAVLNHEGKCIVPWEVLTKRDEVKVNLVGSIVEDLVLTDRLTSFAITALNVTQDVPVCAGDPPISPSQFEEFVAIVKDDADRAEDAKTAAETAQDKAEDAQTAAENAQTGAENAQEAAELAQDKAEDAQEAAELAQSKAEDAQTAAESARDIAVDAKDDAVQAKIDAQAAAGAAETAQGKAEDAQDAAEAAQRAAEAAEQSILDLEATASVDNTVGTPSVDVSVTEQGGNKVMDFDFHNLKGEQGVQGETGNGIISTELISTVGAVKTYRQTYADGTHFDYEVTDGEVTNEVLYSFLPQDTASGDIASFPDGANQVPMPSLIASIEPVQSGSGDPSPTNIRPITGHTEVKTSRTGVNLFGGLPFAQKLVEVGHQSVINTETKTVTWTRSDPNEGGSYNRILFSPKEPMPMTAIMTYLNNGANFSLRLELIDGTEQAIELPNSNGQKTTTVIVSSKAVKSVTANYYAAAPTTIYYEESGYFEGTLTTDEFEPYQGNTYTTALGQTVYGGTLDVVSGVLTVTKAIVDLGTLNWEYVTEYGFRSWLSLAKPNDTSLADIKCSKYLATNYNIHIPDHTIALGGWSPSKYVMVADSSFGTDAEAFKTGANGVQLVYPVDTPQTIQLTPQEVKTLLGDNNVWADTGSVEVTYRADIQRYIQKQIAAVLNA